MKKILPFASFFLTIVGVFSSKTLKALAQSSSNATASLADPKYQHKVIIINIFILLLFVCFLGCLFVVLFSTDKTDQKKKEFATDAIKTLSGFFIGTITGYLG